MAVQKCSAIVLAGGGSTRMGQDKARVALGGQTMLEHVVMCLQSVATKIVVVADTADKYTLPDVRCLGDLYPGSGPVGGILTGLMALETGSHLVVACDMPALHPDVLRLLVAAATPEWDAVVPEAHTQLQPLCAMYRHTAVPKLMKFLESGERAAQRALNGLHWKRIGEGVLRRVEPGLQTFTNINTPEELTALLSR